MAENHSILNPLYYTNISKVYPEGLDRKQINTGKCKHSKGELSRFEESDESYQLEEIDMEKNYQRSLKRLFVPLKSSLPSLKMPISSDPRKTRQCMKECMKQLLEKRCKYPAIDEIQDESSDDQCFESSFQLQQCYGSVTTTNPQTHHTSTPMIRSNRKNMNYGPLRVNKQQLALPDRRCSGTGNDVSTEIYSNNDENSEHKNENINDNSEKNNFCPELIADAVGSAVNKTFSVNKTSIKLKCSHPKYRSYKTKNDELSAQESFNDKPIDNFVYPNDSVSSTVGDKKVSINLHLHRTSDIHTKENTSTENDCVIKNIYNQTSNSDDSSDMETRVGTAKCKRISRIPNLSDNSEKNNTFSRTIINSINLLTEEKRQRVSEKLRDKELKAFRRAEKRKNDRASCSATSRKLQKQFSQHQKRIYSIKTSDDDDTSDSSSNKHPLQSNKKYNSESPPQQSIKCDLRRARDSSSPCPDKKQRIEQNSTEKKNVDKEKILNSEKPRTESSSQSKTLLEEIKEQHKLSDIKQIEKNKKLTENKNQKSIRNSTDSGIGRVTPTREITDNIKIEKKHSKHHHKKHSSSSKPFKYSKHFRRSKLTWDEESIETLQRTSMQVEKLKEISNDGNNSDKPLLLPFINDSDGCQTDDNFPCDNHTQDCTDSINKSHDDDKVISENNQEILSSEVKSHKNQKIHDDSDSIRETVRKCLSSNDEDYSSSGENNDYFISTENRTSVDASGTITENTKTNLIENKANIKSLSNDNVEHEGESAKSKDDNSVANKENLDTKDFLNNKELLKSSQKYPNQRSNIIPENEMKLYEMFKECYEKHPELFNLNISKLSTKKCDNDEPGFKCKPTSSPLIQKEPTIILEKDLEKSFNVTELIKASESIENKKNPEEFKVQVPVFTINLVLGVREVINSNIITSTSTSTITLTSSTNTLTSSTTHPTVSKAPTTSSITAESQSDSFNAMSSNKPCSSTTSASTISTPTSSITTPAVQQRPLHQNSIPTSTTDQLHSYRNSSTPVSLTSTLEKPPPPYYSPISNEKSLKQNNSSETPIKIYHSGNDLPIKLPIYMGEEKTAESISGSINNKSTPIRSLEPSSNCNTAGSQGPICTIVGCTIPNCRAEQVTKTFSNSTLNYNQPNHLLSIGSLTQQINPTQVIPASTSFMKISQNQRNSVHNVGLTNLLTSTTNTSNQNQFQVSANQPYNNIPTQAPLSYPNIYYNQPQRNIFPLQVPPSAVNNNQKFYQQPRGSINQQYNNQAGGSTLRQSNVISTPVGSSNLNNQQFYNQSKTTPPQQPNIVQTSVPFSSINNNQQFYNPQLYNQQFYKQSGAFMPQQANASKPVSSLSANNNRQYNNNTRNLISVQPNSSQMGASTNVSFSQADNNQQQDRNQMKNLTYQQRYNALTSIPRNCINNNQQNYNQSTISMYQQQNGVQTQLNPQINNNQQYINDANTLMSQQSHITSTPFSQINNNRANAVVSQNKNTISIVKANPNVNNNQQYQNVANTSISQKQYVTFTPKSSANNIQQYNQIDAMYPPQQNFASSSISFSQTNNNQRHNNQSEAITYNQQKFFNGMQNNNHNKPIQVQAQHSSINVTTPLQSIGLREDNFSEPIQAQLQQSSVSLSTPVQSNRMQNDNHNETIQVQPQQSSINPATPIQSNQVQTNNHIKTTQAQAQHSSMNVAAPIQSSGLQKNSHSNSVIKTSSTISAINNHGNKTDNLLMVSQALESLSSLPMSYEDNKKLQLRKKKLQNLNFDIKDSSTHNSTKKNEENNDIIKKEEMKQENSISGSSQQLSMHNKNQNDLNYVDIVEVKNKSTFSKKNNKRHHVEDLHSMDVDLRFLNEIENDKDSQKSIKQIKASPSKNVSTNQTILIKTDKSDDKSNSKLNNAHDKTDILVKDEIVTLSDGDDFQDDLDFDRVSSISSDRETLKMDRSDDEIVIEQEHIVTDTYLYTKKNIEEEIDCAMSGENSAFSSTPKIADVSSITNDDFNNIKETGQIKDNAQTNNVPEETDIKIEIDENEYYVT